MTDSILLGLIVGQDALVTYTLLKLWTDYQDMKQDLAILRSAVLERDTSVHKRLKRIEEKLKGKKL